MTEADHARIGDALGDQFAESGIAIIEYALSAEDVAHMDAMFPCLGAREAGARTGQFSPEARSWFSGHPVLTGIARRLAGGSVSMTRLQAFEKSPQANWFVPWHQDRAEDGHERPLAHLENTVALRVHLDACGEDNGPLEVIAGTHTRGRLEAAAIAPIVAAATAMLCLTERGDILAMRPLLLHRSQRAKVAAHRRVIHIEYTRRDYLQSLQRLALAS